jgi:Na+-transporting NADH:ubiquinone oxidoreductase subunit NqrC|tara:strand:- start:2827 stop:3279 length:453 start_codon:yes stop_codon:yes gene_type:complete
MNKIGAITLILTLAASTAVADSMSFNFKNPSFSGQGYSNHVLAIEQLQFNRQKELKEEAEAAEREAAREAANTTLAKFLNNVESRIYAEMSKNLVDGMFEENGALTGTAEIEGATINWVKDETAGTITVTILDEDGTITELVVPLTGFGF